DELHAGAGCFAQLRNDFLRGRRHWPAPPCKAHRRCEQVSSKRVVSTCLRNALKRFQDDQELFFDFDSHTTQSSDSTQLRRASESIDDFKGAFDEVARLESKSHEAQSQRI